ncbi:MAG TPA: YbhB/YbcL family Raf kinase inhibitor-like protein [Panacibacter sp.]|nr:YbhB/YbcL family Raf kinase inhibitor-like protein [Panacibacter sp.]HNP45905.1 YbhB/YbcL family Raf kinase inhibitor-like protein [Panacibacter sp.]
MTIPLMHAEALSVADFREMKMTSPAFTDGEAIPERYTCDGKNINPPFDLDKIPATAKCLAIVADDANSPSGGWLHWLLWNIPVTHHLKEGDVHGEKGINDFGRYGYGGPCAPDGLHYYTFKIYALDALLNLPVTVTKQEFVKEMSWHIVGYAEMTGNYRRK